MEKHVAKNKLISLEGQAISYVLKSSRRARNIRLTLHGDGSLAATKPFWAAEEEVEKFILRKAAWVLKGTERLRQVGKVRIGGGRDDYLRRKTEALRLIEERLSYFNGLYGFSYNRISIRRQRARWGSCSAKGNLNFNYRIIFLPEEAADYIVVHELCHLGEMNHSRNFWELVSRAIPDHKSARKKLKKYLI